MLLADSRAVSSARGGYTQSNSSERSAGESSPRHQADSGVLSRGGGACAWRLLWACTATTGSRSGCRWSSLASSCGVPGNGPGPLRRIVQREGIRTIVTLTAINSGDSKFRDQARLVQETGIRWLIVPMRGSRATPEQMALAADLLADPTSAAGLLSLRRGSSPHQPGPRSVPDPPPGLLGGAGLAGDREPALVASRLGRGPQRPVSDRGVRQGASDRWLPLASKASGRSGMDRSPESTERWIARLAALVLAIPMTWVGWNQATHNFGVLQPGRIYRSGQMPSRALARTVREHHIKTVLNLRGPNPRRIVVSRRGGGDAVGGGHSGRYRRSPPASGCRGSSCARWCACSRPANTPRLSTARGARNAPGWPRRLPSCCGPPAPSPMRVPSSRCTTCTSGSETAESWPSSSISTRTGCGGQRARASARGLSTLGRGGIPSRRSRTARNGLTIPFRWWSRPGPSPERLQSWRERNCRGNRHRDGRNPIDPHVPSHRKSGSLATP